MTGTAATTGVTRAAWTTIRVEALKRGLQVVSVSVGLGVGFRTSTSLGSTTTVSTTLYWNRPWVVVM